MLTLGLGLGHGIGCSPPGFGGPPRGPAPSPAAAPLTPVSMPPIVIDGVEPVAAAALGSLSVRKWALGNGPRIITAPDPTARSVSYVTTYRVGSRDEDAA